MTRAQVKRARERLARFGNRATALRFEPGSGFWAKEAQKYWRMLMRTPADVLKQAAEELNAQETEYRRNG